MDTTVGDHHCCTHGHGIKSGGPSSPMCPDTHQAKGRAMVYRVLFWMSASGTMLWFVADRIAHLLGGCLGF